MCVFSAVEPSESEESEDFATDNTTNPVLEAVVNFRSGELLGECLWDTELGRLALTCHFALDCLGDLWGPTVQSDGYKSDGYGSEEVLVAEL